MFFDDDDYDDQDINAICLDLLFKFTEGITDQKDACEGVENFYNELCLTDDGFDWPFPFPEPPDFSQKCCAFVTLKYQMECDGGDTVTDKTLTLMVSIILLCVVVRSFIRKFDIKWLPEVGGVTLIGIIVGLIADRTGYEFEPFDDAVFMRLLLPPIIFDAAISVNKRRFRKHIGPILLIAFPGTVVSSFVTGGLAYGLLYAFSKHCESIPFLDCLIWGSLISSIGEVCRDLIISLSIFGFI